MEIKKNPELDLNRNSSLYFAIGLATMLFLTWRALESRTYISDKEQEVLTMHSKNYIEEEEEEIPIIKTSYKIPPPPPSAPIKIQVVKNEIEIEETFIESTESNQTTEISNTVINVEDIEVGEVDEGEYVVVPFAIIDDVPTFPGCEGLAKKDKKACFNRKITEHISKHFDYPQEALDLSITGKVYVQFDINAKGEVANIQKRGPDQILEKEAVRLISLLPKMKPGKQRDMNVSVRYSVPIYFKMHIE
ncbi:energy transducer TonB [Flavivirga aquatica]|uniref:Energy transducer TonB n=1 Tax=Flavivirga aquatica TaxID=1849968 RepID=A0A1E5TD07_9FLAO|nr:energy transducer TonB [Flavivirga aquatica]OEK09262.1 energy transducer TonB [Flavivirga aquatica]